MDLGKTYQNIINMFNGNNNNEYDPTATYTFTDKDGNTFSSKGDNGYVWQAMTEGIPISVNSKGEWFTDPYLELKNGVLTVHTPSWFEQTPEFDLWKKTYYDNLDVSTLTYDTVSTLNDILKGTGNITGFKNSAIDTLKELGVENQEYRQKAFTDMMQIVQEANLEDGEYQPAKLTGIFGSDQEESVADVARSFKEGGKNKLSETVTYLLTVLQNGRDGKETDQKKIADAYVTLFLLNQVDDNYTKYGDGEEFKGLLQASVGQKILRMNTDLVQTISEGGIWGWGNRLMYGIGEAIQGRNFTLAIENQRQQNLNNAVLGANLEGIDTFSSIGNVGGFVANIGIMVYLTKQFGALTSYKLATAAPGTALAKIASIGQSAPGGIVKFLSGIGGVALADLIVNDIPIDFMQQMNELFASEYWSKFVVDMGSGDIVAALGDMAAGIPDYKKTLWNPENTQKLMHLGIIGYGADVPGGFIMNVTGDALSNLTVPILGNLNSVIVRKVDEATNGAVTRVKEKATIDNYKLQKKFTNIPILGTGWKKFVNFTIGPTKAEQIRAARDVVIATGSTDPYVKLQNALTQQNIKGMNEINPRLAKLDAEIGYSSALEKILKNTAKYGDPGKVEVELLEPKGGQLKKIPRSLDDVLPVKAKQGLLDIERLSELKLRGDKTEGLTNAKANKEIATLEAKVAKLPQEIKDFAIKLSDMNKGLERIAVELGIKSEDWVNAMQLNPQWEIYMTRQSLVPGYGRTGGSSDPTKAAILNAARKGYYAENYIDPIIAFHMKAEALGTAYAFNEVNKLGAAFQNTLNHVIAGQKSIEFGDRLTKVTESIKSSEALRVSIGYDALKSKASSDVNVIRSAIRRTNDTLSGPEKLALTSLYDSGQTKEIKNFVKDFEIGKIQFAEGVKDTISLNDTDAARVIQNTYRYNGVPNRADNTAGVINDAKFDYSAGVTDDGVPYKYTVEDGKITSMEEITDPDEFADSINNLNGIYRIESKTVQEIGLENSKAINRAILFWRNQMPALPTGPTFEMGYEGDGVYGWIWSPGSGPESEYNVKVVDGHLVPEFTKVHLGSPFFAKGKEGHLKESMESDVLGGYRPKNSAKAENTPIHECGHNTMARLVFLEINREVDMGILKLPTDPFELRKLMRDKWNSLHKLVAQKSLDTIGVKMTNQNWIDTAKTISRYAGTERHDAYKAEFVAEAVVDYWANGDNAAPFSTAVINEVKSLSQRYAVAVEPEAVVRGNQLDIQKGMFNKEGQYAFPKNVKTDKQKSKWLDKWRQDNPYVKKKGKFTDDDYKKANLWDTFFQKEARSYDEDSKTTMPDALAKKNGDYLEDFSKNAAKKLSKEIKDVAGEYSNQLATLVFSTNPDDATDVFDNFIISYIDDRAKEVAAKMPGGATDDNLNTARLTLWSDKDLRNEFSSLANDFAPTAGYKAASDRVNALFDTQANGLAAYKALPVDTRELIAERNLLDEQISRENRKALKEGKKKDAELKGYAPGSTHVISYKESGKDIYLVLNDPVVASLFRRPNDYKNTGVVVETMAQISATLSRLYRIGTTNINPIAYVTNVLRDPYQATVQGGFNIFTMPISPQAFLHSARAYGLDDATIKAVDAKLRVWAESGGQTRLQKNLGVNRVGDLGYRNTAEKVAKKLRKIEEGDGVVGKVINWLEKPLDSWEGTFRHKIAEESFLKSYERTGDVDRAMSQAMFDSSNSTTNFSHAVYGMNRAVSTVPYLSSAINGTISFWRQFNIDPLGMIARITAGFMVPTMGITAWNLSNEERRKKYMALPEWYRDSHLVLMDCDNNIFAFPIPEELQQYYATTRRTIEYAHDSSPMSLSAILAKGFLGFSPVDIDEAIDNDGKLNLARGAVQLADGLIPQAVTIAYEWIAERDLFTGDDLSSYKDMDKLINLGTNFFGSGFKLAANSICMLLGGSEKDLVGLSTANTLSRNLFGMNMNDVKNQFYDYVGNEGGMDANGKTRAATGLWKDHEDLMRRIDSIEKEIATSPAEKKEELEKEKAERIEAFINKVKNLTEKYMQLYTITGGLEEWQKRMLARLLTLGKASTGSSSSSYSYLNANDFNLDQYGEGVQRYVEAGLPSGPSMSSALNEQNSLELQAAINRYYGAPKQAAADFKNALSDTKLKDIRNEFYDAIEGIYDTAEAAGVDPDYDLIEKIQARYLQAVDAVLVPVINQYGIAILNNNDFIDTVRRYVNGMVPSDDWKQSIRNKKKFLSKKDYPLATVDVKKWLTERYASELTDRGLASDASVTKKLQEIKADIDAGRTGSAKGKINELFTGINKANYYISQDDFKLLTQYNNMVK